MRESLASESNQLAWGLGLLFAALAAGNAFGQCRIPEIDVATLIRAPISGATPGNDLVLSADGSTAVLANEEDDSQALNAGAVHVFVREGDQWFPQAVLTPPDAALGDRFGISAALSASGDTLMIGSYLDDDLGTNSGSVYVFVRDDTIWSQQAKLTAPDGAADDRFGVSVALSSDGNTAVIGASQADGSISDSGAAYVFTRTGSTWSTDATKLTPQEPDVDDRFGESVDITADGGLILIGARLDDDGGFQHGAVYVFEAKGPAWMQQAKLLGEGTSVFSFGFSVAVSDEDPPTAVIGAPGEVVAPNNFGSVSMFARDGETWTHQAKFTDPRTGIENPFGLSVGVSGDGNTAIAGFVQLPGISQIFSRTGSTWEIFANPRASDHTEIRGFASRVAIAPDGVIALVQASESTQAGSNFLGYFFEVDECPALVGDLNQDGRVGVADLLMLLASWGPCPDPPDPCPADLDGNGIVGVSDLLILFANWG